MSLAQDDTVGSRPSLPLPVSTLSVQIPGAPRELNAFDMQSPRGGTSLTPRLHESLSLSSPQSSYRGLRPSPSHHVSSRRRLDHGGMAKAVTATPGDRAGQEHRPASFPGRPRPGNASLSVVQPATFDADRGKDGLRQRLSPQRSLSNVPGPPQFGYDAAGSPSPSKLGMRASVGISGALCDSSLSRAISGESDGSSIGGIFAFDGASPPRRAKACSPARVRGIADPSSGLDSIPSAMAGASETPVSRPDSADSVNSLNSASTRCTSTESGLSTRSFSVASLGSFGRRSSLATASSAGSAPASNMSSPASASPPPMAASHDDDTSGSGGGGGNSGAVVAASLLGRATTRPSPTRSARKPPPRVGISLPLGLGGAAAASAEEADDAGVDSLLDAPESEFDVFSKPRGRGLSLSKRLYDAEADRLASASPTTATAYRFGGMAVASPLASPLASPSPSPSPPLVFSGRRGSARCLHLAETGAPGEPACSAAEAGFDDTSGSGVERASPPTPLPDAVATTTGAVPTGLSGLLPVMLRSESPVMLRKRSRTLGLLQSPQPRSGSSSHADNCADALGIGGAAEQQQQQQQQRSERSGLSLSHGDLAGFTLHRSREGKCTGHSRHARGSGHLRGGSHSSDGGEHWHVPPARSKSADRAGSGAASSPASASASSSAMDSAAAPFTLQRSCSVPFAEPPQLLLPTKPSKQVDLKVITHATLAKVLDGEYDSVLSGYTIVDCRFDYEYAGGHVRGGKLLNDPQHNAEYFFREPLPDCQTHALIFHCEFSQNRAPKMMRHIRELDRKIHMQTYPELYYPQMYLLEDGYKNFFAHQPDHCEPRSYMPMDQNKNACGRSMSSLRASWKEFKDRKKRRDSDSMLRRSAPH